MFELIKKMFSVLEVRDRKNLGVLMAGVVVMGFVEMLLIVSIVPFISVVAKPDFIQSNKYLRYVYEQLGFNEPSHFLLFLGVIVLVILVLGNAYSAFMTWLMLRFTHRRSHTMSRRLLSKYLLKEYSFFLGKNTSELTKNILGEVGRVVSGVMLPMVQVAAKLIVTFFVMGLLVAVDPVLALVTISVLAIAFVSVYYVVKEKLSGLGVESVELDRLRFKSVGEALRGVKEIKVLGVEDEFLRRFNWCSLQSALNRAASQAISMLPKFALETIAFGGIMIIVLYLLLVRDDMDNIMPMVALYALAGYRLMPSLQQVFMGVSNIRYNSASLDVLSRELCAETEDDVCGGEKVMSFTDKILLKNISYSYPGTEKLVGDSISIEIKANTIVGFAGHSGSGKSTLINVILGLLAPTCGDVYVDDVRVSSENVKSWQKNIGYVPQGVYLVDDTIISNIAFGVPLSEVDVSAVENAARVAQIHDFIMDEMPSGYQSMIGESGSKISGGQRQRLGIARAIYRQPKLLVLDEATSALDSITEKKVVDEVARLSGDMTVIMIAHRLTTLKHCDVIHVVDHGRVVGSGLYEDLEKENDYFSRLVSIGKDVK